MRVLTRLGFMLVTLLVGVQGIAVAQSQGDRDIARLSEAQAIELALENSRKYNAMQVRVQVASSQVASAAGVDNPELRISDVSTRYFTDKFDELELGLRWQVPRLGELPADRQQARVRLWEERLAAHEYKVELINKVRKTYADVLLYEMLVEYAERRIEMEKRRITIVENMADVGRRTIVYLTKARFRVMEAKNDLTRWTEQYKDSVDSLKKLTGRDVIPVVFETPLPVIEQPIESLIAVASDVGPELRLNEERMRLAEQEYDRERFRLIPWFTFIQLSYHLESDDPDWGELTLGIELPLFNWNQGDIAGAQLAMQRRSGQMSIYQERLELDVKQAYDRYRQALLDYRLTSKDSVVLKETAQQVIDEANQHDIIPHDEIIELETTILNVNVLLCRKRHVLAHALADLYEALGVEDLIGLQGS